MWMMDVESASDIERVTRNQNRGTCPACHAPCSGFMTCFTEEGCVVYCAGCGDKERLREIMLRQRARGGK